MSGIYTESELAIIKRGADVRHQVWQEAKDAMDKLVEGYEIELAQKIQRIAELEAKRKG